MKAVTAAVKSAWSRLGQRLAEDDGDTLAWLLIMALYIIPSHFDAYINYVGSHWWLSLPLSVMFVWFSVLFAYAAIIRRKRLRSLIWRVWMSICCMSIAYVISFYW